MPMTLIDSLLQVFAADRACGDDLGYSNAFDRIAEMRREDDPTLDQGEWKTDLKVADWPGVATACEQLLRQQTKDLRVAGWWAEACSHTQGLVGLADGLMLAAGLVREHWDGVYPLPDGTDFEERVGSLAWLLGRVQGLSRLAPLLVLNRTPMGLGAIDSARQRAQQGEPAPEGQPTWEAIQRALALAGRAAFDAHAQAIAQAQGALTELQGLLDARLGQDGPGFASAHKALGDAELGLRRLGRECGLGEATEAVPTQEMQASGEALPVAGAAGPLRSRAQALQQLRDVAAYFRRTEPHSPVAYLAEKAARWGELPLHAWLRQVLKDEGMLSRLDELLGLDQPPAA